MTGIGIVIAFITFLIVSFYLTKRYHQNFRKLFYRLPILILLTYFLWSYFQFLFNVGVFPTSAKQLAMLISPYWYEFNFIWIILWLFISVLAFLKKIKRIENKKIRANILFYSITLSIVPLWIFLMLWDNFIWQTTTSAIWISALHSESELNKFNSVYPIWLFLSIGALLVAWMIRVMKKKFANGVLWFAILLFITNIVIIFQQYPRHGVISLWEIVLDIKQYISFVIIMFCLYIYNKRNQEPQDVFVPDRTETF